MSGINDVCLVLIQSGDTLGELPIGDLLIGISETGPKAEYEVPAQQVACIYAHLAGALAHEGFEIEGDEIDFQLAVSRALVEAPIDGTITIPLNVRLCGSALPAPIHGDDHAANTINFDDVFNVTPGSGSLGEGSM